MTELLAIRSLFAVQVDNDPLRDMGSVFRSRTDSPEIGTLLIALGILLAVVLLVWGISRYLNRNHVRRSYYRPRALFRSLCHVHQLDRPSRQLLWKLAQSHDLRHPARLFVEPERFEPERLPPPMLVHAKQLGTIRERLFPATGRLKAPPEPAGHRG